MLKHRGPVCITLVVLLISVALYGNAQEDYEDYEETDEPEEPVEYEQHEEAEKPEENEETEKPEEPEKPKDPKEPAKPQKPKDTKATPSLQRSKIIPGDPCQIFCGRPGNLRPHTLCTNNPNISCPYSIFTRKEYITRKLKREIIFGHNGLRNRVARFVKVANMLTLQWDAELAKMAAQFLGRCRPYRYDKCAIYKLPMTSKAKYDQFFSGEENYKFVAQNRFCKRAEFFPHDFVEETLSTWYNERNNLKKPEFVTDSTTTNLMGELTGENNFTHLASPLTNRLGCSIARFDTIFCMFCNYFPYYHGRNRTGPKGPIRSLHFEFGEPLSFCPDLFPLKNLYFENLCSSGFEVDASPKRLETRFETVVMALVVIFSVRL